MECERTCGGITSIERRYPIYSRLASAAFLGSDTMPLRSQEQTQLVTAVVFGEDLVRMRMGNAAKNFSILRRISLNHFRQDTTIKIDVKTRQLLAAR